MILIIDTSYSHLLSIGLVKGSYIFSNQTIAENPLTVFWKSLENLLNLSESNKREIEYVSISIGPGPFTSLRNGISIARTISQILNIPIIKFSLTEVIENEFKHLKPTILFDGRAKKLVIKRFGSKNLELVKIDDLKNLEGTLISIGCKEILPPQEKERILVEYNYIPIEMILKEIKNKINRSEFCNFNEVLPIYHK